MKKDKTEKPIPLSVIKKDWISWGARIPPELRARVDKLAIVKDMKKEVIVRMFLEEFLKKHET